MTREQIAALLLMHGRRRGIRDRQIHCHCGWTSSPGPLGHGEHLRHQADVILAELGQPTSPPSPKVENPETPHPPRTMTTGRGPTHPRTQTPMGM